MLQWIKGRRPATDRESEPDAANAQSSVLSGISEPLYKYLDGRYADAVVLTFAEIEDLIGSALPEVARLSRDWWTTPDPDTTRSRFADSWIQARRIARPNLHALTVAFERAC
jgi:hypothetical protein